MTPATRITFAFWGACCLVCGAVIGLVFGLAGVIAATLSYIIVAVLVQRYDRFER